MNARLHPAFGVALGDAEELDGVAHLACVDDVDRTDLRDAFPVNVSKTDVLAEAERGEDGQLVGRVVALDVEGRIGLGAAHLLCLKESGLKVGRTDPVRAFLAHAGQDEVGRAVEDPADGGNVVGRKPLVERAQERDSSPDRPLEEEADLVGDRGPDEVDAVGGDKGLVRRNHVFLGLESAVDQVPREIHRSGQFQNDVDVGVGQEPLGVVRQDGGVVVGVAPGGRVDIDNARDADGVRHARFDDRAVRLKRPDDARPDVAEADDPYIQRRSHSADIPLSGPVARPPSAPSPRGRRSPREWGSHFAGEARVFAREFQDVRRSHVPGISRFSLVG
jgi:hypothetical protein